MTITDIGEARRRRERIVDAAAWVMANVPYTLHWPDYPDFRDQWSDMTGSEIALIDAEVRRMLREIADRASSDPEPPTHLQARYEWWTRAANWLVRYSDASLDDERFQRHFGHLTRNEAALALIVVAKRRSAE